MAERDEMMQLRCFRVEGVLLAVGLAAGLASTAAAQQQPTIAVLPAQYYSADASSAQAVTQALMARFKAQGYRVMPLQRVRAVTAAMRYRPNRHYTDGQVVGFGRRLGAPLVAYPRLLALGYPAAVRGTSNSLPPGAAVLHLRVINARTKRPVYFRQIASEFGTRPATGASALPPQVARAAADKVTQLYFQRVAGSRQEIGRAARSSGR
jgi:hypothetical protein